MLMTRNLRMKSSEISIKTRSPPASLSFKGQATKHTTVESCLLQSYLDYPDLDYPDFSIIRTFSLVPFFFMNINKLWSQKLSEVKNV